MNPVQRTYAATLRLLNKGMVRPEEVVEIGQQEGLSQEQLKKDVEAASAAGKRHRYEVNLSLLHYGMVRPEKVVELGQQAGTPQKQLQEDVGAANAACRRHRENLRNGVL